MRKTRDSWGLYVLILTGMLALARGWLEETPGHFRMFMGASHALWTGGQAYDVPFLGNLFFYSPSSAMFVYGPFGLLPERAGLLVYLALSAAIFIWGARRFAQARLSSRAQWALAALAPAFFSSLVAHKLEVITTGALLAAMAGGFGARAGLVIGSITQWKFQTLPALGLLAIERYVARREVRGALAAGATIAAWTALPLAFVGAGYLLEQQGLMSASLTRYSSESFDRFDNFYSFLRFGLGFEMTYRVSQLLALMAGLIFALVVAGAARRPDAESELVALALGSAFTVLFSPLQQISAYILLAPVWLLAIGRPARALRRGEIAWLAFLWCALTLGYSDFVPEALRQALRSTSSRTLFAALLSAWTIRRLLNSAPLRAPN